MRIVVSFAVIASAAVLLLSCSDFGAVSIRLVPGTRIVAQRAVAPDVDAMDCYFVSVDFSGAAAAGVPACFGIGRVSALGTYADVTTAGLSIRAPVGLNRRLRIWGVGTPGACAGKTAVGDLFTDGARPSIFPIADQTVRTFGASSILLTNQYVAGFSPNTGACDGPPPTVGLALVSVGLHRGGVVVPVNGSGFEIGAKVSVGGTDCTSTEFISGTEIRCTTPALTPAKNLKISVRNPNGIEVASSSTFTSRALLFAAQIGTPNTMLSYGVDPETGSLTLLDSEGIFAGTALISGTALHPSGLWILKGGSGGVTTNLEAFPINPETGALGTPVKTSVPNLAVFEFSPDGKYLVVMGDSVSPGRYVYSFNSTTGVLTGITQSAPAVISSAGLSLAFSPSGSRFFAALASGGPVTMALGADGQTTSSSVTNFPSVASYFRLLTGRSFMIVGSSPPTLRAHDITADVSWTETDVESQVALPINFVSASDGSFGYALVSNGGRKAKPVFVSSAGLITEGALVTFDSNEVAVISLDPSGKFLAASDGNNANEGVAIYSIHATTKELITPLVSADVQASVTDVTFD